MQELPLKKTYKKSRFSVAVKVDPNQLKWLKVNKDTRTIAGYLDKIINQYKFKKKRLAKKNMSMRKRIWIFIAYKEDKWGSVPVFSKLFDDHCKLKEFSAKHSAENEKKIEGYHSTYLDLIDTSLINKQYEYEQ